MAIVFILLPISISIGLIFLIGYIWSVYTKQYDDLNTPAIRILSEESFENKEK